jgi:hypothetical protein
MSNESVLISIEVSGMETLWFLEECTSVFAQECAKLDDEHRQSDDGTMRYMISFDNIDWIEFEDWIESVLEIELR